MNNSINVVTINTQYKKHFNIKTRVLRKTLKIESEVKGNPKKK